MPSDEIQDRELRKQMREGRAPLIEAVCAAWQRFFIANKGLVRKADELREQVGIMQNEFSQRASNSAIHPARPRHSVNSGIAAKVQYRSSRR